METMKLNRQDQILKLIVETFIKTCEPVGSHTLLERYNLNCSSATIRNDMKALEERGFIEKTHTSSGRVPSSKGYRYYVENLRDHSLDDAYKYQIRQIFQDQTKSVDEILSQSCEILSEMTNLASAVLGPNVTDESIVSIQIVPINENSITAIFVTDRGYVENKTYILPTSIDMKSLINCVKIIDERVKGTKIVDLVDKVDALKPIIQDYLLDSSLVYQVIMEAFVKFASSRVNFYGQDKLLERPEYKQDLTKLKKVLNLLHSPDIIKDIYARSENDIDLIDESNDLTIITTKLNLPGLERGKIALLGPSRIDYDRVLSAIDYLNETLDEYFEERSEKKWKKKKESKKNMKKK